jgi:hypothetical protein
MKSTNPEQKEINQKRGPTIGNEGTPSKRKEFVKAKSTGERKELADMINNALEKRGRGQRGSDDPSLESIKDKVNVGRGPTKGNK